MIEGEIAAAVVLTDQQNCCVRFAHPDCLPSGIFLPGLSALLPANHRLDPAGRVGGIFVLPDANDGPSGGVQDSVIGAVALDVAVKFRLPVVRICGRVRGVNRTAMPEAAIDKHRYV